MKAKIKLLYSEEKYNQEGGGIWVSMYKVEVPRGAFSDLHVLCWSAESYEGADDLDGFEIVLTEYMREAEAQRLAIAKFDDLYKQYRALIWEASEEEHDDN